MGVTGNLPDNCASKKVGRGKKERKGKKVSFPHLPLFLKSKKKQTTLTRYRHTQNQEGKESLQIARYAGTVCCLRLDAKYRTECLPKMSEVLIQLGQCPGSWFSPIRWQAPGGTGQGVRQTVQAGRRSFPSETDLNWIEYGLQGGESLSEEVVPDFSQNLNAIFTYTRARRWEGRKKEKNVVITHRSGWEAVPSPMEHRRGVVGESSVAILDL